MSLPLGQPDHGHAGQVTRLADELTDRFHLELVPSLASIVVCHIVSWPWPTESVDLLAALAVGTGLGRIGWVSRGQDQGRLSRGPATWVLVFRGTPRCPHELLER